MQLERSIEGTATRKIATRNSHMIEQCQVLLPLIPVLQQVIRQLLIPKEL